MMGGGLQVKPLLLVLQATKNHHFYADPCTYGNWSHCVCYRTRVGKGEGESHIKVTGLTIGNFERKPLKVSGSYFVGVLNSLSLPTGTFLKGHVTTVIFVSGLIP